MVKTENFKQVEVTSVQQLRTWLEENHSQENSIWLVTYKKHLPDKYVSVSEILDELLCFGWIDGVRRKLDADRTMQLIAPRKTQHWAKSYKERAAKLIKEGKMQPNGEQAIANSKKLGLWDFMDDVDALIQPDDLVEAFKGYPQAAENFEAFAQSSRRNMLRWIKLAKRPETRSKRIEKIAFLASKNEKLPGS